jgi:hydroxypyruvate reductase
VTTRFDPGVLVPDPEARAQVLGRLEAGLAAVEPEALTAAALSGRRAGGTTVIAIGKAAPAMARGAASVLDVVGGVCVTDHPEPVPETMSLLIGDHPVPGPASLEAGAAVLDAVRRVPSSVDIIALVSGGGSALCEAPREGVPAEFLSEATNRLISGGADIEELNLVRAHLSAIKCGGVARAAGRPIDTYVISDVAGAGLGVVASGPTIPAPHDPQAAAVLLARLSIDIPPDVWQAMRTEPLPLPTPDVTLLADGSNAARAAAGVPPPAHVDAEWLRGEMGACLDRFLARVEPGMTVAAGEVVLDVTGPGSGGRNTHAALLAAERIAGSQDIFCAFATDGVDGRSGAAGGVVDGSTIDRGGDPAGAFRSFDSASYLSRTSDLLRCPPTGTNVSDLWILWRRG